jgi:hypothetical protein
MYQDNNPHANTDISTNAETIASASVGTYANHNVANAKTIVSTNVGHFIIAIGVGNWGSMRREGSRL